MMICRRGLQDTNADEAHFAINLHSKRTLTGRGNTDVKHVDVVSADEIMTTMVLSDGGHAGDVDMPITNLKNLSRPYPI